MRVATQSGHLVRRASHEETVLWREYGASGCRHGHCREPATHVAEWDHTSPAGKVTGRRVAWCERHARLWAGKWDLEWPPT